MTIRIALAVWVLAAPVAAQDWQVSTSDDGSFFYANARTAGLALECGGQSPQRLSPAVTGNVEPLVTPPYAFFVVPDATLVGTTTPPPRSDVVIHAAQQAFRLPALNYNEFFSSWMQPVAMYDPLITALRREGRFAISVDSLGQVDIPSSGARAAIEAAFEFCASRTAAFGHPVPPELGGSGSSAPTPAPAPAEPVPQASAPGPAPGEPSERLKAMVAADIAATCGGTNPKVEPGYMQVGDIDADGQPDILMYWGDVNCNNPSMPMNGYGGGFCGASQCSGNVYLSSQPDAFRDAVLGQGAALALRADGGADLAMGMSLAECSTLPQPNDCTRLMRWNGRDFDALN
ncbi:MAG: hypothetical protein R3D84_10100 [Paracoccaceae bacterium]